VSSLAAIVWAAICAFVGSITLVVAWLTCKNFALHQALKKARWRLDEWEQSRALLIQHVGLDLRNRLNAVAGLTILLLERPFPPEKLRTGLEMRSAVDDLAGSLTAIISYFSDLTETALGPSQSVDLRNMLAQIQAGLITTATLKGVHLECHLEPGAPLTVQSFPELLSQLLASVLQHSVAVTNQGFVELIVHAEPVLSRTTELMRITIRDSSGLTSPAALQALFEPYGLNRVRTGGSPQGMGLHLIIARRLSQVAGGSLTAAADGEGGTLYTIVLPVSVVERSISRESVDSAQVVILNDLYAQHRREVGELNILVIDDQASNQFFIENILQRAGHMTTGTSSGEGALKLLAAEPFDVILVDLTLPGISGWQLLRRQHESPSELNLDTPMIVVTGDTSASTRKESFLAGARGYVTKPVSARSLLEAIAAIAIEESAGVEKSPLGKRSTADGQVIQLTPHVASLAVSEALYYREALGNAVSNEDWGGARIYVRAIQGVALALESYGLVDLCQRFLRTSEEDLSYSAAGLIIKIRTEIDDMRMEVLDRSPFSVDRDLP
jgi:CheY-like chemotaxis protein